MLTVELADNQGIFLRLPFMANRVRANVQRAVTQLAIELQHYIVKNKLSGQVLNKRTGHLQQSIQQTVTSSSNEVRAKVFSAGNVKYAAIHEYGGIIPAHVVQSKSGGALAFMWQGKQVFFKSVQIPAIRMPERSYMRSSLQENKEHIITTIKEAVIAGIKE